MIQLFIQSSLFCVLVLGRTWQCQVWMHAVPRRCLRIESDVPCRTGSRICGGASVEWLYGSGSAGTSVGPGCADGRAYRDGSRGRCDCCRAGDTAGCGPERARSTDDSAAATAGGACRFCPHGQRRECCGCPSAAEAGIVAGWDGMAEAMPLRKMVRALRECPPIRFAYEWGTRFSATFVSLGYSGLVAGRCCRYW
jgi:hypothetical protein